MDNERRISRYLSKTAATTSAEAIRRMKQMGDIGGVGSFFWAPVDAAQNEMLSAAAGEDDPEFVVSSPYVHNLLSTLGGAAAGAAGGGALGAGAADTIGGRLAGDAPFGGVSLGTMAGIGAGALLGGLAGRAYSTHGRREARRRLLEAVAAKGVDERAVRDALAESNPTALKGGLAELVAWPYGAHESNKAETARALLGEGETGMEDAGNIGGALAHNVPLPYLAPAAAVLSGGLAGNKAERLRAEMGIEPA